MTAAEMAARLNGREYKQEMKDDEILLAKENGLVVVYGFSDDTTVFHGGIEAEVRTLNNASIFVTPDGIFEDCPCDCIHSRRAKAAASRINVLWCKGAYVWHYDTTLPHEVFDIIDNQPSDSLKFCQGMVFKLDALGH